MGSQQAGRRNVSSISLRLIVGISARSQITLKTPTALVDQGIETAIRIAQRSTPKRQNGELTAETTAALSDGSPGGFASDAATSGHPAG
jgi:hypothetical protein